MLRPLLLVLVSAHINVVQAPSLLLEAVSRLLHRHEGNVFARLFTAYNRVTQRLFTSLLVCCNYVPWKPVEIVVHGAEALSALGPGPCVLTPNHQTQLDWMYFWIAAARIGAGRDADLRIVLKDSLKNIPIFGWGMHFFSFIFLSRKWDRDEKTLVERSKFIADNCTSGAGSLILLFPEGTIISPDTLAKSHTFADKAAEGNLEASKSKGGGRGLANRDNKEEYRATRVLIPRYKALWACLKELSNRRLVSPGQLSKRLPPCILDVTVAFEPVVDVTKGVYPEKVFSPKHVFLPQWGKAGQVPPTRIHFGIETVSNHEWTHWMDNGNEDEFDGWLKKRWRQKEVALQMICDSDGAMFWAPDSRSDTSKALSQLVIPIVPTVMDIVGL
ncbi:acyltransferase-domain-containing protein [Chytriomyces sp. MP71]|nr:acyltransferase-domain-containing protein [Chytriomyces sp. MP71]